LALLKVSQMAPQSAHLMVLQMADRKVLLTVQPMVVWWVQ
jgi:hypothetical protein